MECISSCIKEHTSLCPMTDMQALLHKLHPTQHNNEYLMDFKFVGVSQQYNIKQYFPYVYPSSTIRSFITAEYPDRRLDPSAITIGCGVLINDQPHSIKWSTLSSLGNKKFQDVFGPIKMSGDQRHLLICNLFSKTSFHSEMTDLRHKLADMESKSKQTPQTSFRREMNEIRLQLQNMEREAITKWTPQ